MTGALLKSVASIPQRVWTSVRGLRGVRGLWGVRLLWGVLRLLLLGVRRLRELARMWLRCGIPSGHRQCHDPPDDRPPKEEVHDEHRSTVRHLPDLGDDSRQKV